MGFDIGQRVGDYEIVGMLGVGGMGRVYRVRNVISDRTEAMKVLLSDLTAEPDLAARFSSEIRMLASFDHPNIAQLHTAFQIDNQLVMMMEFVEGVSLQQRAKQGPIPQADVIGYMQQVLSALSYAHGRGVVHRDVKPANIMVTSNGVVKLMDFGIAKSVVEQDLTRPGTTMGSLYYMSPEQVRGDTVDARSDIYSVGVVLYELLAGSRPFEADSAYSILNQQCNVAPRPPVEVNAQMPAVLSDLILCCLAKDPVNRFQNAQALSNALRQIAAADAPKVEAAAFAPVAAAQPAWAGAPAAAARPASTHRGAWITLGAFLVLAVVAAAAVGLPRLLHTSAKTDGDRAAVASAAPADSAPAIVAPPTPAQVPDATPPPATPLAAVPAPVQPDKATTTRTRAEASTKLPRPEYRPGGLVDSANQPVNTPPPPANAAPDNGASAREETEQAQEQKTGLEARATAVSASVESLKSQQQAEGLGLRQDMATAYARMNSYLRSASAELGSGNITAARSHMDKADKEISILESFFGK